MSPEPTRRHSLVLAALGVLSLVMAVVAANPYRRLQSDRAALHDILETTGLIERRPELARRIDRESDPERAKLAVGRALLADALDTAGTAELSADEIRLVLEDKLEAIRTAHDLATSALLERPAAWQGYLIAGGATYLEWSLTQDRRLYTDWRRWGQPLETAMAMAPGEIEPKRFLAMAYLEMWPALGDERREIALGLVRESLEDPATFRLLLAPWLEVAADIDEAFALLPDKPHVWQQVEGVLARQGDWPRYCEARGRFETALETDLAAELTAADERLSGGDLQGARGLLLDVIHRAPADGRFAPLMTRAMARLPPGLTGPGYHDQLTAWLHWGLERCLYGDCVLPPESFPRLARGLDTVPSPLAARIAVATGDLPAAEREERLTRGLWRQQWAPYLIQKAPALLAAKQSAAARAALDEVHETWHERPVYLLARSALAQAENGMHSAAAERAVDAARREAWDRFEWESLGQSRFQLELLTGEEARGLSVVLDEVPPGGGAAGLLLDGETVACLPLRSASRAISADVEVPAGLHVIEIRPLAGGGVVPGPVRLRH